jgi:hypothetical protein
LSQRQDPNTPRLALNTYCRPFLIAPGGASPERDLLGIWCPEPGYIRLLCFDPDELKAFSLIEVAGWFKQSTERVYSATPPLAELEISSALPAGEHAMEFPKEFHGISEILVVSSHPARDKDDPACAIFVLRPQDGLVQVLPQRWFTPSRYDVGQQWITRVVRDPVSQRIVGDGFRIGMFELNEEGTGVERWLG